MAQQVVIAGALFNDVPSISVPDSNNVYHPFVDTSDADATAGDIANGKTAYVNGSKVTGNASTPTLITKSITANGTYNASSDSADGYSSVTVNVSGGGIGQLLATKSLGYLSTTSTSQVSTGQSITLSNYNDYDVLIVETSRDTAGSNQNLATIGVIFLYNSSNIAIKTNASFPNAKLNLRTKQNGDVYSYYGSAAYGVYNSSATIANGVLTIGMAMKYSGTYSGTIDGNYTTKIYGVNCYSLV